MLHILVMGAGAIGCFVGGTLAAAGHNVTLVGRPALMNTIKAEGLSLSWPGQPAQVSYPAVATAVSSPAEPYDFVLLTVKSPATATAAHQLTGLNWANTGLVSLQNGIGNEELLAQILAPAQVMAGTITIPIETPAPGQIKVSKNKGGLGLAPLAAGQPVSQLAQALNEAGLTTVTYDNYQAMKWSKLLLNIINNATSAILNQPPAEIINHPELFNLELAALQEAVAVMHAQHISAVKLPGYPAQWLARLVAARWLPLAAKRAILRPFMQSGRGSKMPSLQIDLAAGRTETEIEALNGAVVRAGQALSVATPVNRALTTLLSGIAAGQLDWHTYQHQPRQLLAAVRDVQQANVSAPFIKS